MFIGLGTVANVVTVAVGSVIGLLFGSRIPERTRQLITATLGLVTLVLGISSAGSIGSTALAGVVGKGGLLVVIGALLVGGLIGSALRIEQRLEGAADWLRSKIADDEDSGRFVDAVVTPTLLFCVGPLTILGSLSDGLGRGADQLLVKSLLDGFAAIAFAASLGYGVLFSAVLVGVLQGGLTLLAFALGDFLSLAQIDALTATGGVILMALSLRLLQLKQIPVGDMLPALLLAPVIVAGAAALLH
ncbi:DUF554 domain-containing protein [Propioniciclava tarda]|uniref:DUF554 domain-containing protein n=1 Tax=Propioniciclava tarda TaxID=433330 RepID=A0A4Q9KMS9_PROTD|nr:DUF554 domain-containing protein [Propioniciclava tarda]TBT95833.1 DUF554 domain-containing protein [Propioniciclava tarda]SMO40358.1 hypothetical protein SAMN06266982_10277 [Propioniciclava tarda]HOA90038.1 DUF554 domain-containing protein [Propioniciclava tarda]HQA30735.1 DUF554 domain-containing protein [Propioniciclava tarda]